MALAKASNRARETSVTTGTGTLSLGGAVDAMHTTLLQNVDSGSRIPYCIASQEIGVNEWEVGWGIVTSGSPATLTRISAAVEESSNTNALVSFTAVNKHVWIGDPASQFSELPGLCNGRLSLSSTVPLTTTDVTGSSADDIYWVPYQGNGVSLIPSASYWKRYQFAELTIPVPSSSYFRIYDVFVYNNAGTLALELNAWDSAGQLTDSITGATAASPCVLTTPTNSIAVGDLIGIRAVLGTTSINDKVFRVSARTSTTITLEGSTGNSAWTSGGTYHKIPTARTTNVVGYTGADGVLVKSGDGTRRFLGTFMTTSVSGQTEDSATRRLLWNYYNRVERALRTADSTDSWTYTIATWRPANAGMTPGTHSVWAVQGLQDEPIEATNWTVPNSSGTASVAAGIGLNRTVLNDAQAIGSHMAANWAPCFAKYHGNPALGFNMLTRLEIAAAVGTVTWYGDNGTTYQTYVMQAAVKA